MHVLFKLSLIRGRLSNDQCMYCLSSVWSEGDYLMINLYSRYYFSFELRFGSKKNKSNDQHNQLISRKTWWLLARLVFFRVCVGIFKQLEDVWWIDIENQRYYMLGYFMKIVLNTLTTSFFLPWDHIFGIRTHRCRTRLVKKNKKSRVIPQRVTGSPRASRI